MKTYHDIAGDGGSDVLGQVLARSEKIEKNLSGVRRRLAVGSGKGGVGKSTVVMQLALELRRRGETVAILDADLNGPTQARLAGLEPKPPVPGTRGLALPRTKTGIGVVSTGTLLRKDEALDFESASSGDSQTWRATKEFTFLAELLASVEWGELDWLLFDLPPGAERITQYAELFGENVPFVLVTIPTDISRGVVARSADALAKTPNRVLGVVENMAGYRCPDCGSVKPLFPEGESNLDLPVLGRIPFDPALALPDSGPLPDPSTNATALAVRDMVDRIFDLL